MIADLQHVENEQPGGHCLDHPRPVGRLVATLRRRAAAANVTVGIREAGSP